MVIGVGGPAPGGASTGAQADFVTFSREVGKLDQALRRDIGHEDLRHLQKIECVGRLFSLLGLATAWIAPNPLSAALLAQGMMARFIIGHHVGHGGYDSVPGIPARYTRKRFARGWRRFVDWQDWWQNEDWLYTHNHLHHPNTQAPLDKDVMDSTWLCGRPIWLRLLLLGWFTLTWKFSYYAPRMRRERAWRGKNAPFGHSLGRPHPHMPDVAVPPWMGSYAAYMTVRFFLPALIVSPLGAWAAGNMLANLMMAELFHNAQTFVCIRPSHCAADIALFTNGARNRTEFNAQTVLGTVNYHAGGDVHDFLHGWTNYQVEHHLWPSLTLLQYRKARPQLLEICRRTQVPYREDHVFARYLKMARLFMGLQHQPRLDTNLLLMTPQQCIDEPQDARHLG